MTLEEIIRYAIRGYLAYVEEYGATDSNEMSTNIEMLVDILIDFSAITGNPLIKLLEQLPEDLR